MGHYASEMSSTWDDSFEKPKKLTDADRVKILKTENDFLVGVIRILYKNFKSEIKNIQELKNLSIGDI